VREKSCSSPQNAKPLQKLCSTEALVQGIALALELRVCGLVVAVDLSDA
jgi:hypothetical protein